MLALRKNGGVHDVLPQAKLACHFLGNGDLVASDHLHLYAHLQSGRNRAFRIYPWRIEQWQNPQKPPMVLLVGASDTQGAKAPSRELIDCFLNFPPAPPLDRP